MQPLVYFRRMSICLMFLLVLPGPALAQEPIPADVAPVSPFQEGDVIDMSKLERIKSYIPEPFWENREYFFYEGMNLRIGKFHADYSSSEARKQATQQWSGQVRLGPEESLEDYVMGEPFPEVDPNDPDAGVKLAWNLVYHHDPMEGEAHFFFSYWDQGGERLPIYYEGQAWGLRLARRTDRPKTNGFVFKREKRMGAGGGWVTAPFDARGIKFLGFRYVSWEKPPSQARDDDAWVYIPDLRRVRRISTGMSTDAIAGTDFTPEDFQSFMGVVPEFRWKYLGETELLTPIDTQAVGYPYEKNANFGPTGFSLANDVWDLRRAYIIEFDPKDEAHPYSRKTIWIDKQAHRALYSAAYDRRGELWKLMYHANRWSESPAQQIKIDGQRTFLPVCDVLVNVRTGTGNRIEIWDVHGTQWPKREIRRRTDVGRLNQGGR